MINTSIFDTPPDFVNEIGTKWWKQNDVDEYAQKKNINGITLINVNAWCVETVNKHRTYVLVDTNSNQIIFTTQMYESLLIHIDYLKILNNNKSGV